MLKPYSLRIVEGEFCVDKRDLATAIKEAAPGSFVDLSPLCAWASWRDVYAPVASVVEVLQRDSSTAGVAEDLLRAVQEHGAA